MMSKANMEAGKRGRPRKKAMPAEVRKVYLNIKKVYENPTVSWYAGKYRAYVTMQAYSKKRGKKAPITAYIGWIDNGKLVPPKRKANAKRIEETRKEYANAIAALSNRNRYLEKRLVQAETAEKGSIRLQNSILTYLSMNCRATAKEIAKSLNEKPAAIICNMHKLERKYGIHYTIEMNLPMLGYYCFIALGRFTGAMPTREMLAKKLAENSRVQLAFLMAGGKADIAVYYLERVYENEKDSIRDCYDELEGALHGFNIEWTLSQFFIIDGQFPVRDAFFADLKEKGMEDAREAKLTYKKFAVLKELFINARQPLSDINRKYGFDANSAYNALCKLIKGKVILWNTINIEKAPVRYYAFIEAVPSSAQAYEAAKENWLKNIAKKSDYPINKYALVGEINAPRAEFVHIVPVLDNEGLESVIGNMQKLGMATYKSIITDVLVGNIPLRRFDEAYSQAQKALIEEFWRTNPKIKRKNYWLG